MMCYAGDLQDGCQDLYVYIYIYACVCNINIHYCTYNYIYKYTCVCLRVCFNLILRYIDFSLVWILLMDLWNQITIVGQAGLSLAEVQDMVLRTWPKLGQVYYTAQEMTLRMAQGFCWPLLSTNLVLNIGPPVHPLDDQILPYFPYVWCNYQATFQGTLAHHLTEPRSRFLDFVSSCPRLPPGGSACRHWKNQGGIHIPQQRNGVGRVSKI